MCVLFLMENSWHKNKEIKIIEFNALYFITLSNALECVYYALYDLSQKLNLTKTWQGY